MLRCRLCGNVCKMYISITFGNHPAPLCVDIDSTKWKYLTLCLPFDTKQDRIYMIEQISWSWSWVCRTIRKGTKENVPSFLYVGGATEKMWGISLMTSVEVHAKFSELC